MISTRGRYALRVVVDLAQHDEGNYIPLKEVAARQGISIKYLEQIIPTLTKNNLVVAAHGKGGGYRLSKDPGEIKVGDILILTETSLAPVACLSADAEPCERRAQCKTIDFWSGLNDAIVNYIDGTTIADLI